MLVEVLKMFGEVLLAVSLKLLFEPCIERLIAKLGRKLAAFLRKPA